MNDRQRWALPALVPALGPVTKRQLELIERFLNQPPALERHLTPGGMTEDIIKRMQRENAEVDAAYIRGRLARMDGRASRAFARAAANANAKEQQQSSGRRDPFDVIAVRAHGRKRSLSRGR